MRENEIIRTETVAKEYELSEPLAREIVTEETQRALRGSWVAWLILLLAVACAGYVFFAPAAHKNSAFWLLLGIIATWLAVGRYLAGPAIRKAAKEKAARLQRPHS